MSSDKVRVGEIRPSQLMFSYGVGAIIDLPQLSVIVTGLEDWPSDPMYSHPIVEDRLLMAVRYRREDVKRLLTPPIVSDTGPSIDPFDSSYTIGVPVAPFPRWMVCPRCRLLAPLSTGLFELKDNRYHPDRTSYRHTNCPKGSKPVVMPARFLAACEKGHLDDFPWIQFVHKGKPCAKPWLRLIEYGVSGEARDLEAQCQACGARRRLSEAFGTENREKLPLCRARRPHLRDFDPDGCEHHIRTLILGASNTWFPIVLSTVAIPVESGKLAQLVDDNWAMLQKATAPVVIDFMRNSGQLGELSEYSDEQIWETIQNRQQQDAGEIAPPSTPPDLKAPEWQVFVEHDPALTTDDFRLRPVPPPSRFASQIEQVVLVERLREVRAMIGFSRLDAAGELTDPDLSVLIDPAPITRRPPTWVPAAEVRGEGIFIQFRENRLLKWLASPKVSRWGDLFFDAHKKWRSSRFIKPPEDGFPGVRYVLLHTFAHVLMRQMALECGYAAASIRERIYSRPAEREGGPMAGILIYTSAPDSEGTLGGLVSLGKPEVLERHIGQALEAARLCASDPLCAEHPPSRTGRTLHAAACHACLFAPETSCERGNKYLDRSVLVHTVENDDLAFFE